MRKRNGRGIGDEVDANVAMSAIAQMQWREALQDRTIRYVVEGSSALLTPEEAEAWVGESAAHGYRRIRFVFADDDGRTLVVELAASSAPEDSR